MKGILLGIAFIGALTASPMVAQESPGSVVLSLEEAEQLFGDTKSPALAGVLGALAYPIVGFGYADNQWGRGAGVTAVELGGFYLFATNVVTGPYASIEECNGACVLGAAVGIGAMVYGIVGPIRAAKARNRRIRETRLRRVTVGPSLTKGIGFSAGIRTN